MTTIMRLTKIRRTFQRACAGVIAVFLLALVGCSTISDKPDNKYWFNTVNALRLVQRNPAAYQGQVYAFWGEVISATEAKGKLFFQIRIGSGFDSEFLGVIYPSTEPPVVKGHWVKVLGTIAGEFEGRNAFGGRVQQVVLNAHAIQDQPCDYCKATDYFVLNWAKDYMDWAGIPASTTTVGIGIIIQVEPDALKIISIIPGGPANQDNRLKVNDRIEAIAEENGPWTPVKNMTVEDFSKHVRGKSGTTIRLRVIAANAARGAMPNEISLVRKEIALAKTPKDK
jgi:ribosomal protein L29